MMMLKGGPSRALKLVPLTRMALPQCFFLLTALLETIQLLYL